MTRAVLRVLAFGILVTALAGCATYRRKPIDAAVTGRALQARSLTDPRLLKFLAAMGQRHPPLRWGLKTLTLVAVYERPTLRIANADLSVALANGLTARALPNPTLSLAPTYNASNFVPSPWKIGPLVTFLIESYGARPALIAESRALLGAARAKMLVAAWEERAAVRDALLSLWYAEVELRAARRGAALAGQVARVTEQRYSAGMISAASENLAEVTAQQQDFARALARRREKLARVALAGAIGMPSSALRRVPLSFDAFRNHKLPTNLKLLRATALATRPDIQASLADYSAAQDKLRFAIAGQYPSVAVGPGYNYDQGQNKYILSLSLPLPIFNQNQGPIAAARAGRKLAAARFELTQQNALAQIDAAIVDLHASFETIMAARTALNAANARVHYAHIAFTAGAIGRLRMIGAEQAAYFAQTDLLTARMQERTAIGRVESALYHPIFGASAS